LVGRGYLGYWKERHRRALEGHWQKIFEGQGLFFGMEGKLEDFEINAFNKLLALSGQSLDTISIGPAQMNPEVVRDLVNNGYIPKPENWDTDQTDVILEMLLDKEQAPTLGSGRFEQNLLTLWGKLVEWIFS